MWHRKRPLEWPKGKRRADLLIAFVLVALLFSFGEVSAQEIRSGWEVVDSGTEENLYMLSTKRARYGHSDLEEP